MMRIHRLLLVLPVLVALAGCSKAIPTSPYTSDPGSTPGPVDPSMGRTRVLITDAPGDFDAVNLVVEEVDAVGDAGTQVLFSGETTIDLLGLQNGVFATVADQNLPVGHYSELLLKIGTGSNVVVDGVTQTLKVPSSKLHLTGSFDVVPGVVSVLQLDFDAAASIKKAGSKYQLQPHIRVLSASEAGSITGLVAPAGTLASVEVAQDGSQVGGTWANGDGTFKVAVLPAGTYCVTVRASTGDVAVVDGVVVTAGGTTSLGTISFGSGGDGGSAPPPPPVRNPGGKVGNG
jgi:hypothetical protein